MNLWVSAMLPACAAIVVVPPVPAQSPLLPAVVIYDPFHIPFGVHSTELTVNARNMLNNAAAAARRSEQPSDMIFLAGHIDRSELRPRNRRLACRRTAVVKEYLVRRGFRRERIVAVSHVATRPLVIADEVKERGANRRVELLLFRWGPDLPSWVSSPEIKTRC